jgi:hypothetical protein
LAANISASTGMFCVLGCIMFFLLLSISDLPENSCYFHSVPYLCVCPLEKKESKSCCRCSNLHCCKRPRKNITIRIRILYVCVYCCFFPFWAQKAASEQVLFVLKLLGSFGARQLLSLLLLLQLMCFMFETGVRLFLCPLWLISQILSSVVLVSLSFFLSVVVVDYDGFEEFLLWLSVKTGDWTCGCFLKAVFLFPFSLTILSSACMHKESSWFIIL